jgi:hypothetical protein
MIAISRLDRPAIAAARRTPCDTGVRQAGREGRERIEVYLDRCLEGGSGQFGDDPLSATSAPKRGEIVGDASTNV